MIQDNEYYSVEFHALRKHNQVGSDDDLGLRSSIHNIIGVSLISSMYRLCKLQQNV
jgi:hypothetical protein